MNAIAIRSGILILLTAPLALADEAKLDVRHGVPTDAYIAVYGQRNPERDFQRQYAQQVWQTVRDEKLPERILALVMERIPGKEMETITSISHEVQSIFESVDWSAVAQSPEVVYGQVMEPPQSQHLLLLRLPSDDVAASCETALKKLGEMMERRSEGAVDAAFDDRGEVRVYSLSVSKVKEFPFQPAFARIDDVLVVSSSATVLRASVDSLLAGGDSKFDDPRLVAALERLPRPEDALAFYDGQQQFQKLRSIGQFIREKSGGDPNAARAANLFEKVIDEVAILDYEVTVEYTEGERNRKEVRGQLATDAEGKLLYRVLAEGEPFEDWQRWVPADAQAYTLSTGANLHALYEGVVQFLRDEVPEAQPGLEKFEQLQQEWGIHLDRDVLQAFSGQFVSVKLPASSPNAVGGQDQVVALRCHRPERIRELIGHWVDQLAKTPFGQNQQLRLAPSQELAGFDELSANALQLFGARPVVGFHDGWMIVASNAQAAQRVLRTLSGDAPSIDKSEQFRRFGLEIEGPVHTISYSDLAGNTRRAAQLIRHAGLVAPMMVGMASAKTDPEKLKPLQDGLALLPAVANVVEKFDYLEARLTVVQPGDTAGSYVKHSVTLVRPPKEKPSDEPAAATGEGR